MKAKCPKCGAGLLVVVDHASGYGDVGFECISDDCDYEIALEDFLAAKEEENTRLRDSLQTLTTAAALVYLQYPPAKVDVRLLQEAAEAAKAEKGSDG